MGGLRDSATLRRVMLAVIVALVMFFGPQVVFRHRINPFSVATQIFYHGRGYRGGHELPSTRTTDLVRVGSGVWPERAVLGVTKDPPLDADLTWVVIENWDGRFYSYSLQGGP